MYKFINLFILLGVFALSGAQETQTIYLSGTGFDQTRSWDFYCSAGMNSGTWTTIEVPSCWEQQGFGAYVYGHVPFEERLKEEGHYRTSFMADKSWKDQHVALVFEGVMSDARVEINGKSAGEVHQGAFYPFSSEVSSLLRFGKENQLDVYVKKFSDNMSVNQAERKADYWIFGGIFRPVYLEIKPRTHIRRVAVDARADGSFRSDVFLGGKQGSGTLRVEILDEEGTQLAAFSKEVPSGSGQVRLEGKVKDALTWSPEFPHLHTAHFSLEDGKGAPVHTHSERIGFRTVEVRAQDGIYVNGERIKFKGVNRHSFHPDHGRTSSKAFSIEVVNLIKDMNMNAVRMSHYPPDRHFLDVCDSLGLFVLDELAGWQKPPYDSVVGRKLLKAMIARDVNHPSIVLWDNGNEGGWNTVYDTDFRELDIQQREVLHPWAVHEKMNTAHYINYDYLAMQHFAPRQVFFPTEFLHGLYDGGHGAGLEDYWLRLWNHPLSAGGFLWVFADEAVKRSDSGELDSDGNHAPDGILGPYHEKEGSFYAIRESWSPVHVEKRYITPDFNGEFRIQNRFHYTGLDQCTFSYSWEKLPDASGQGGSVLQQGNPLVESLLPGQNGKLKVELPVGWREADVLRVEARDPHGRFIHGWSWPVKSPEEFTRQALKEEVMVQVMPSISENPREIRMGSSGVEVRISKLDGSLLEVKAGDSEIPLSNGPRFLKENPALEKLSHFDQDGSHHVEALYADGSLLRWTLHPTGLLDMHLAYHPEKDQGGKVPYTGANFSFPESDKLSVELMGRGPYRVWQNRMAGPAFGLWDKAYNNTITGHSGFEYPEFKGYYAELYRATILDGDEAVFTVYSRTEDLFLRLFTPEESPDMARTTLEHPAGDLGFMLGIPAIGTKFKDPDWMGPGSQGYLYDTRRVSGGSLQIDLSFDFR